MTTKDRGSTLPELSGTAAAFSSVSVGISDGLVLSSSGLAPVNSEAVGASPKDLILSAQSASGSFAAQGGDVVLRVGIGTDAGTTSGDFVLENFLGTSMYWRSGRIRCNENFYLWLDGSDRLRSKRVAPTSDSDGSYFLQVRTATSFTWDPASIANGAQLMTTNALANAAMGDAVIATSSIDLLGLELSAYVHSAGNCTVRLKNGTGGAVDLGSMTVYLKLIKN